MEAGDRTSEKRTGSQARMGRWYGMPTTVFVLGLLSMAMLTWTSQLSQRQRMHFALDHALMDLRLRFATAHLWLEEAITYDPGVDIERVWSDLRKASRLSEALLNGGEPAYGVILEPLKDPDLRRRAEDIRRILSEFTMLSRDRVQRPEAGGIGSALDERCDALFDELQRIAGDLDGIIDENQASDYANSKRLLFGIFVAWSSIVVGSTTGLLRRERRRRQAEEALQFVNDGLERKVADRTRELSGLNDQLGFELNERKKTQEALRESEEQLRHLSDRLLTAQETERRRISKDLHDEVGHSLYLMNLRLRLIENQLKEDQSAARKDCEDLSQFIKRGIEEVRRLSRDLSPTVLEHFGLSAALRWLVDNSIRNDQTNVVSSIIELDHLFSHNAQVMLYRVIQEALTNVGKHAQAKHVSLAVRRHGDWLSFVVEDDGKGFDVKEGLTQDASERGIGLATMAERARMLGGSLKVWSEEGKGTRIALGVPVREGGSL